MKIDKHVHTKNSKDSNQNLQEIVRIGKKRGLDGVAITDHNKITLKRRKKISGFIFLPGVEIKTEFGEILVYNIKKIPHSKNFFDLINKIKKNKGCILVIPHAFDKMRKSAIQDEKVLMQIKDKIDYMEINGRSFFIFRKRAIKFAKKNNLKLITGSDAHFKFEIGNCYSTLNNKFQVIKIKPNLGWFIFPLILTKIKKILTH